MNTYPKGMTFTRAAIALALAGNDPTEAHELAARRWGDRSPVAELLMKSAIGGASSSTWSELADAREAAIDFLEYVRPRTILGKLEGLRKVPVNVPFAAQSGGAVAYWTAQGKATPVSRGAFDRDALSTLKLAALLVISEELLAAGTPESEALIRRDLAAAVVELSDRSFIDPANTGIPGEMPAAVTAGVTPIASTGNVADDIETAVDAIGGSLDTASWVMNPRTAVKIGLRLPLSDLGARGGMLAGLPVITSEAVPLAGSPVSPTIALVDAAGVCVADEGVEVRRATQAAVEMSDAPSGDTLTPTAASTELVSLFQTDSVGLLVTRRINWMMARAGSVVVIDGATYAGV